MFLEDGILDPDTSPLFWRHYPCLRRYLGHVRDERCINPARGPNDRYREHFLKTLTRPDIVTVAHRVIVHAALTLLTGPCEWERWPIVFGALHSVSLQYQENMDVRGEV